MNDYPYSQHKRNNQGRIPLHTAAEYGQLEVLKYLMQYSRHPNAPGNDGETTTMGIAASMGHVEIVKFLAIHIADSPNEPDKDGWTPLHDAAFSGQLETIKVLLNYIDNPNILTNAGQTPIDLARENMQNCGCKKERKIYKKIIKLLKNHGNNASSSNNRGQKRALSYLDSDNIISGKRRRT